MKGALFSGMKRFVSSKIQEIFSATKIVDLQQHHEGSSLSMEAIGQIGGLGRLDCFDIDGNPKKLFMVWFHQDQLFNWQPLMLRSLFLGDLSWMKW